MGTATERMLRNALKFGTTGEVDSKEGVAPVERLKLAPPNRSEVWAFQGELDGAVGEALILKTQLQCIRTKIYSFVVFDDQFLDL